MHVGDTLTFNDYEIVATLQRAVEDGLHNAIVVIHNNSTHYLIASGTTYAGLSGMQLAPAGAFVCSMCYTENTAQDVHNKALQLAVDFATGRVEI